MIWRWLCLCTRCDGDEGHQECEPGEKSIRNCEPWSLHQRAFTITRSFLLRQNSYEVRLTFVASSSWNSTQVTFSIWLDRYPSMLLTKCDISCLEETKKIRHLSTVNLKSQTAQACYCTMDDYKGLDKETETGFLMQICCLFVYLFVCLFVTCFLMLWRSIFLSDRCTI